MQSIPPVEPLAKGWIHAVRTALGMSARQLAKRLHMTPDAVAQFERNERSGGITLASLTKVANALDCDVVVQFKPRTSLDALMRAQAMAKAQADRERVLHTMRLESQESGVRDAMDTDDDARRWMTERIAELWD
jgi:predicted DNA-binding mobile mystery protein A